MKPKRRKNRAERKRTLRPLWIILLVVVVLLLTIVTRLILTPTIHPTLSITLDHFVFHPGDAVGITVGVRDASGGLMGVYVDKPDLTNLYYFPSQPQNISYTLPIPFDAPLGNYTVTVTLEHSYARAGFLVVPATQPIPEFNGPVIVAFAVLFAPLFLLRHRRR